MRKLVSMREALADPALLGSMLSGPSWASWRVVLIGAFGEALSDEERVTWRELTGREEEPLEPLEEGLLLVGRRGGKTRAAATAAVFVAGLVDHAPVLAPGERGVLAFLAASQRQAAVALGYAGAIIDASPMLGGMVTGRTADTISLANGVDLEVRPASFKSSRGVTAVGVIGDEVAFWPRDDSANPDAEILNAFRPALATTGGPMILITSPYARRGEVWNLYKRHYGPTGDRRIVVVQAASRTMNPSLPESVVRRALERDEASARAEYLAQFRTDVEALLTREAIEACVDEGVFERGPIPGVTYFAFVDPSGGSNDSMTLAIAHRDGDAAILDAVRERKPPFSPEAVVTEFAAVLKSYGLRVVTGDRYGGLWPRERFAKAGIEYRLAEKPKSDLYGALVATVNSNRLDLLDLPRLTAQLIGLERRTARGGRDSIDHAPGQHDDVANVVAGVAYVALVRRQREPRPGTSMLIMPDRAAELDGDDDLFDGPNSADPELIYARSAAEALQ